MSAAKRRDPDTAAAKRRDPGTAAAKRRRGSSAVARILGSVAIGIVAALVTGLSGAWPFAPVIGWIAAGAVYLLVNWIGVGGMTASATAAHATREDPTVPASHAVLLIASLASLGGVVLLLLAAGSADRLLAAALGVASVAVSWFVVHTVYTLRYAAAYYAGTDGGIDFNQTLPPAYLDFAYLGFTLGMTYQVSDTTIGDPVIRRLALQHALVSYLLGAVVLAITINLVVNIAH